MVSRRHTRLSGASLNSNAPRQARSSLVQRAQSVASCIKESRAAIREKRANHIMERREINKFVDMAEKHVPKRDEIGNMDDIDRHLHLIKLTIACLLRASCTSRREIEQIVLKVMEQVNSGNVFDDDLTLEQTQARVGNFLLGNVQGISMVDTLVPVKFSETKELKKSFNHDWPLDSEFTSYAKIILDKKRAWKFVLCVRQKMTERLNKMIAPLFVVCPMLKKSVYDKAIGKAMTTMIGKYSVLENYPRLPESYLLEREFAFNTVVEVGLEQILKDWASHYYLDIPNENNDEALIGMLNSRAQHKGAASLNLHYQNLLQKIKAIRLVEEDNCSRISTFPYSQSTTTDIDDFDFSDPGALLEEKNEASHTMGEVAAGKHDGLDEVDSGIQPDLGEVAPGKGEVELVSSQDQPIPASQKYAWKASFDSDSDGSENLIEFIDDKEPKKAPLPKPTLPYMRNKRKRESTRSDPSAKRMKQDLYDGMPQLESLE